MRLLDSKIIHFHNISSSLTEITLAFLFHCFLFSLIASFMAVFNDFLALLNSESGNKPNVFLEYFEIILSPSIELL